jgi:hypothetical protein
MARTTARNTHFLSGGLVLALACVAWIVTLAGVSAIRKQAGTDDVSLSWDWWVCWFTFAVLVLVAAQHFMGYLNSRIGVVGLLAVVTSLIMYENNQYYTYHKAGGYPVGDGDTFMMVAKNRVDTAFAGWIMLAIFNTLLMLIIGTHPTEFETSRERMPATENAAGSARPTGATIA